MTMTGISNRDSIYPYQDYTYLISTNLRVSSSRDF